MSTGSNAVIDLVREASTRRLETDPGDAALFESRDEPSRNRWPRGTVNWSPPPPEPVTHPPAPTRKRASWMLKLGVLAIAVVTGFAVAMIGFSKDAKVVARPQWIPPPLPVVAAVPASIPEPPPPPVVAAPAVVPVTPPTEPTIASPTEPTIAPAPTIDETPPVVEPRLVKAAPTKAKRRVHADKKRVAKSKHVAIATTAPIAPTAPTTTTKTTPPPVAAPVRRSAQAHDTENPL